MPLRNTRMTDVATTLNDMPLRAALAEIARDFHARGWMSGTAGNLSAREDAEHFWITASGKPKGRLDESDFLLVRIADGEVIDRVAAGNKPSAETGIHRALYARFPEAQSCLHGHSIDGMLVSGKARAGARAVRLAPIEMIKGFDIWKQNPKVDLPLFDNHLDVARIVRDIETRFRKVAPPVTALMVRSHGATVWGGSLQEAYNRFEILEFILGYMARARR
jgi:methylthioribulose-1-phosphate dehydratase